MKVKELKDFLKQRGLKGYSTMKKGNLQEKVRAIQKEEAKAEYEKQLRDNVVCYTCLKQQNIQRKIDDQRLLESMIRDLVCEYCQHANLVEDGDNTFCTNFGALQSPEAACERKYWR